MLDGNSGRGEIVVYQESMRWGPAVTDVTYWTIITYSCRLGGEVHTQPDGHSVAQGAGSTRGTGPNNRKDIGGARTMPGPYDSFGDKGERKRTLRLHLLHRNFRGDRARASISDCGWADKLKGYDEMESK
jgi:hypothetical protein